VRFGCAGVARWCALLCIALPSQLWLSAGAYAGTSVWTSGGPYGTGVAALAIDPKVPSTLYLVAPGSAGGAVFKSANSGDSWTPAGSGLPRSVYALAIDPTTPSTLYAATSEGVYKSADSGGVWAAASAGMPNVFVNSVAIDPATPAVLYAGTSASGVYKSTNAGGSWAAANSGLPEFFTADMVVIDGTAPATLYAVSGYGNVSGYGGIFKSTDAGGTWAAASLGLSNLHLYSLAIDPATPSTLYAATGEGVYKSTDSAASWTSTSLAVAAATIAIDQVTPSTLYAGSFGGGVFKSGDSGGTWAAVNAGLSDLFINALVIDPTAPSILYAGPSRFGPFKSTNAGTTWARANGGIANLAADTVAVDSMTPGTAYAGTPGGLFKSTDSGGTWVLAGLDLRVNVLAIDPVASSTVYAGTPGGLFKSTDSGGTWVQASFLLVSALAIDPVTPSTVYAGADGLLYQSQDGGGTWVLAAAGLPTTAPSYVRALAIDPQTPTVLYAVVDHKGVYKSIDAGGHWTSTGLVGAVSSVVLDPTEPSTLYAGTLGGGVFESADGGHTWASTGLKDQSIDALVVDASNPSTLYAGSVTDGVFRSTDGGGTWTAVNKGLLNTKVNALALDSTTTTVYAALPNGVWQATPPTGLDSDLSLTLSDAPDPVTGTTPLTYEVAVTNNGPGPAGLVHVSHTLPAGVVFESADGSGWACGVSGAVVTCTRPGLAVGEAPPISVQVTPGPVAGALVSSATVVAPEADPDPANNSASETTTVNQALVWYGTRTKTASAPSGRFVVNGDVTYAITLRNDGSQTQADNPGPEVEDDLPPSLELVDASSTSGSLVSDGPGNRVLWNGSLPGGGSVTITIRATIKPTVALGTSVANQATAHYDADGNGSNEATALTDDPAKPGANDPTLFLVVSPPQSLYTLSPCRLVDTRDPLGTLGGPALQAQADRTFALFGRCGIPATARALSVNLTVTGPTAPGNLRVYPAATPLPNASFVNYDAQETRANNAVVTLNGLGELAVFCAQVSGTAHLVLDVNGYFE